MAVEFLMGNEAIALGAIRAGVSVVTGYPGTPSSEILDTVARRNPGDIYVEWSVNEKVALEVAAGASYAGVRTMVTMKQVGLNVASDPLMSLAYIGVTGGMVVVVADDPGPISSQTEQDTRHFAAFSKLPVFDPVSPEEAYEMIGDAFAYSEKYGTPVLFRPTTRICHGYAPVDVLTEREDVRPSGFVKDDRWVIFPRLSYLNHLAIEERQPRIAADFSEYRFNTITSPGETASAPGAVPDGPRKGIVTGGISDAYVHDALEALGISCPVLRVATPHPFPAPLALEFLSGVDEVLVVEELDPVIERELVYLIGRHHLAVEVRGKLTGHTPRAGENSAEVATRAIADLLGLAVPGADPPAGTPPLPARPPVLCAGCPHRASFLAVKQAMRGRKAVFSGDIGCYTLGNAAPLNMVDTCLCMGAGITIAQGLHRAEPDAVNFAFVGDSTFFHSGITGVINAVYNQTDLVVVVLDNATTAMTGHQPHPGLGRTMMGDIAEGIDIAGVLRAVGVRHVETCDPLKLEEARAAVERAVEAGGVSAVIFKSPCIAIVKSTQVCVVDEALCTGCMKCISALGCPALERHEGIVRIDPALCTGCELCIRTCPFDAIGVMVR